MLGGNPGDGKLENEPVHAACFDVCVLGYICLGTHVHALVSSKKRPGVFLEHSNALRLLKGQQNRETYNKHTYTRKKQKRRCASTTSCRSTCQAPCRNHSSPFLTTRKLVVFTVRCPTPANKNPVTVSCQGQSQTQTEKARCSKARRSSARRRRHNKHVPLA